MKFDLLQTESKKRGIIFSELYADNSIHIYRTYAYFLVRSVTHTPVTLQQKTTSNNVWLWIKGKAQKV